MTNAEAIRRAIRFHRLDDPDDLPAVYPTLAAVTRAFNKRGGLVYAVVLIDDYEFEHFLFGI